MIGQSNVLPQTMVSTPGTIPIQSTVSQTRVIPNYGATSGFPVQSTVQSTVPLYSNYQTPSTFVSSTQPQTKYKIWNMLVPAFQPEPQPQPVQVAQTVSVPEPVPQPIEIPAQTYEVPAEQTYETYEEPTYSVPETQYVDTTQYQTTATPNVNVIKRGSGITMNEQQSIINCAINVYQNNMEPFSNNTAKAVKKTLGGDWLVIVYSHGKPIDFNMTCVQGNDYLYFTLDNLWAYQVCRLR
jgi:hypothetical protein